MNYLKVPAKVDELCAILHMCGSERERVCVWIIAVFCMRHTGNVG